MLVMDDIDKILFKELSDNSRVTVSQLSAKVGLSMPAVSERLKKFKTDGIIEAYTVRPGQELFESYPVVMEFMVRLKKSDDRDIFHSFLDEHDHVVWYSITAGNYDCIAYIRAKNIEQMGLIIVQFSHHPAVSKIDTLFLMKDKYKGVTNLLIN